MQYLFCYRTFCNIVAGSIEISNSLKRDLLEIGALYDYIEDYNKYADIGDSCAINTIN